MTIREKRGRNLARAEDCGLVGVRAELRQAALGAARADHVDAAVRRGRGAGASAGIRIDAGDGRGGARQRAARRRNKFRMVDNMDEAFRDADVVIPKSWGCLDTMGANPAESLRIAKQYTALDLRRGAHETGAEGRALHAPAAGRPRQRGDRRGDRRTATRWSTRKPRTGCIRPRRSWR